VKLFCRHCQIYTLLLKLLDEMEQMVIGIRQAGCYNHELANTHTHTHLCSRELQQGGWQLQQLQWQLCWAIRQGSGHYTRGSTSAAAAAAAAAAPLFVMSTAAAAAATLVTLFITMIVLCTTVIAGGHAVCSF